MPKEKQPDDLEAWRGEFMKNSWSYWVCFPGEEGTVKETQCGLHVFEWRPHIT